MNEILTCGWWLGGVAALAMALGAVGAAGGCSMIDVPLMEARRSFSAAHDPGGAIRVETKNGAVSIARAEVPEAHITAKIRAETQERLDAIGVVVERGADGTLVVRAVEPADGWRRREGVGFVIALPGADGVKVTTSNGAVTVEGLAGPADLTTSNGALKVNGHDGPVRARTSNGSIRIVGADDVALKTSNGSISAAQIRGAARAETSNGAVTLRLAPESSGPITVETSNGAVTLEVGETFAGTLSAATSRGRLSLPPGEGHVRLVRVDPGSAELRFGDGGEGGEPSSVRTSNGSVTIRLVE